MPSKTPRQARFNRLCATPKGRARARQKCPPIAVAREFVRADTAKARRRKAKRGVKK